MMIHWKHLLGPDIPIAEKILRSVVVYFFMLIAFRLTGKRQVGRLTPFDLVVLLIISNVVQNAVIGDDTSLGGGLIGAVTIFLLNFLVVEMAFRFKRARDLLEPHPTVLVHNGKILRENLKKELISVEDLQAAIRENGLAGIEHVKFAILEDNGEISVIPKKGI